MKLLSAVLCILLAACSDQYHSLYEAAPGPVLSLQRDTLLIRERDSVNAGGLNKGKLVIYASPSERQLNLQFSDTSGKLQVFYRGQPLQPFQPLLVAGDSTLIYLQCDYPGTYRLDLFLTDQLGKQVQRMLIVVCMPNARPLSELSLHFADSSRPGNWIYDLDASASSDGDGVILGYYFLVDGQAVFSPSPVIQWVFYNRGEHTITLFLLDDLGLHSDTIIRKLSIP